MEKEKTKKQSFVMYNSFVEAASNMDAEHAWECVLRIRDYALFGIDEKSNHWGVNMVMDMAKPLLDSARKRYEKCVENGNKGKIYGNKGGRPKKDSKPQEKPLNVNVNEYVKDNVDEKVDEKVDEFVSQENPNQTESGKQPNAVFQSFLAETDPVHCTNADSFSSHSPLQPDNEIKPEHPSSRSSSSPREDCLNYIITHKAPTSNDGLDAKDYYEFCLAKALIKLVKMDIGTLAKDDTVFFNAVNYYKDLYGVGQEQAIKDINILKARANSIRIEQQKAS